MATGESPLSAAYVLGRGIKQALSTHLDDLGLIADAAAAAANDASAAVVAAGGTLPNSADYDASDTAVAIVDASGNVYGRWLASGALISKLAVVADPVLGNGLALTQKADGSYTFSLGTKAGALPVGNCEVDGLFDSDQYAFALVDPTDKIIFAVTALGEIVGSFVSAEVEVARGTRATLNDRLSRSLTAYGLPTEPTWGLYYLRETRQRLRKLLLAEATQFRMAMIGDSWTHLASRYSGNTAATLQTTYGYGAAGWCGFGFFGGSATGTNINGNIRGSQATVTIAGTWTSVYASGSAYGPDICQSTTTTTTDKVTVTGPALTTGVDLFSVGTTGSLRYRWDGGSWTTLDMAGSGLVITALTGVPATAFTLELEHVSGTVTLCGVNLKGTANGVIVHKLGASGSRTSQWAGAAASQWQTAITSLAPDLVTILHGTNDQDSYSAATFRGYLETIIDRIRIARPTADILLVAPCENIRPGNVIPMADYQEQTYQVAAGKKCGFLNLQSYFGETPAEYGSASARPWFNADNIHPEPTAGGRTIVDALVRVITQSL